MCPNVHTVPASQGQRVGKGEEVSCCMNSLQMLRKQYSSFQSCTRSESRLQLQRVRLNLERKNWRESVWFQFRGSGEQFSYTSQGDLSLFPPHTPFSFRSFLSYLSLAPLHQKTLAPSGLYLSTSPRLLCSLGDLTAQCPRNHSVPPTPRSTSELPLQAAGINSFGTQPS